MGIQGLLPYLKKASRATNVKEFKGCTVAIDTYCWLHRGAFACAEKLAMGEKTDQYVYYCMKYVNFLLSEGIKPIMVFDGCHLPSKREVEKARRERRDTYRKKAAQFMREGKRSEARDALTKCIDITPQMALELMNTCRAKGVDCIVAPYEADAQLAYLAKVDIAQVVITEDSDLILFGCKKVLFKMDFAGNGMLVEKENLNVAMDLRPDSFTFDKFRYMCILSGCDYLPSLPGIGLGKATKIFKLTKQTDMNIVLKKLPTTLKMSNLTVPGEYLEGFQRANRTFLYQLVYDPRERALVPLHPYPPEVDTAQIDYAGPHIEKKKALQIALGNIDIYTGERIADFNPDTYKPKSQSWGKGGNGRDAPHLLSIWDRNYQPMSKAKQSAKSQDSLLSHMTTKGQEVTVKVGRLLPKKSPLKRPRDPEPEVSDAEILSSYQTESECEQPIKRQRGSSVNEVDINLYRDQSLEPPAVVPSSPSPRKKLVSPHKKLVSPRKKILSPPPGRNVFAASNQKPKDHNFSLNARKKPVEVLQTEVKSRFFKEKKPLNQTSFFRELDRGHECAGKEEEEESDGEEEESETEEEDPTKPEGEKQTARSSNDQASKDSPYRSFGFSKKSTALDKFKSSFDKPSSSKNQDFKPVIPKTNCSSGKTSSQISDCITLEDSCDISESESTNVSQRTNLYSIDSSFKFDMGSQDLDDFDIPESQPTKKPDNSPMNSSKTVSNRIASSTSDRSKFFYQCSSEKKQVGGKPDQDSCSSNSSTKPSQVPASRPGISGCRASGLSKSSVKKGKANSSKPTNENQPGISQFFNKFNYKKTSDKLSTSSEKKDKKVLSPHRDN